MQLLPSMDGYLDAIPITFGCMGRVNLGNPYKHSLGPWGTRTAGPQSQLSAVSSNMFFDAILTWFYIQRRESNVAQILLVPPRAIGHERDQKPSAHIRSTYQARPACCSFAVKA